MKANGEQSLEDLLEEYRRVGASRAGRSRSSTNTEPFAVLGLQQGASASDIRKRHRELMLIHHPDRGGRTEVMSQINAARDAALKTA